VCVVHGAGCAPGCCDDGDDDDVCESAVLFHFDPSNGWVRLGRGYLLKLSVGIPHATSLFSDLRDSGKHSLECFPGEW
jgi:hypothetical protein